MRPQRPEAIAPRPLRSPALLVLVLVLAPACSRCGSPPARLDAISPRMLSNQSSVPVMLYGENLPDGLRLRLGAPFSLELPTARLDARHLTARIPPLPSTGKAETAVAVLLAAPGGAPIAGQAPLVVIDDAGYPTPSGLAVSGDGRRVFALSSTTDELWAWDRQRPGAPPERIAVGDGPQALAIVAAGGAFAEERLAIVHEHAPELRLVRTADPRGPQQVVSAPAGALGLAIDPARGLAYVSSHRTGTVQVIDLASGRAQGELPAGVRPRGLALDPGRLLAVANAGSGDVSLLPLAFPPPPAPAPGGPPSDGGLPRPLRAQPRPGTPMIGGHTEGREAWVVGGRQPRAIAFSAKRRRVLVASAGLNLGPNPERREISTNGGIGVIDPATGRWERHVSILAGIPQALALDDERGLLWAADLSRGLLTVLDVARLCESDQAARRAVLASLPLALPPAASLIRPDFDGTHPRRAGVEIHAGPESLALADGGRTVLVLSRFSGGLTEIDAADPARPRVRRLLPGPPLEAQRARRLGEIVYFTDLGRSSMSCDACHPGGHDDGVFYAKNRPQRFYRAATLRAVRETPPYFFPAQFPTLEVTAGVVLGRNRLHDPDPSGDEIAWLALWQRTVAPLPNPFHGPDGSLPETLRLPDGRSGSPAHGLVLFEGKAGCAGCHPAPQFTLDQAPETRGRSFDVGTPVTLPLHLEWQDAPPGRHQVPSLTGAWDEFPLLASGAGGLEVAPDGALEPRHPFALRRVLEWKGDQPHGGAAALSEQERDDLLAYLLTL